MEKIWRSWNKRYNYKLQLQEQTKKKQQQVIQETMKIIFLEVKKDRTVK